MSARWSDISSSLIDGRWLHNFEAAKASLPFSADHINTNCKSYNLCTGFLNSEQFGQGGTAANVRVTMPALPT